MMGAKVLFCPACGTVQKPAEVNQCCNEHRVSECVPEEFAMRCAALFTRAHMAPVQHVAPVDPPHKTFTPRVYSGSDGGWIAHYSDIYVTGATPAEAVKNFDYRWFQK